MLKPLNGVSLTSKTLVTTHPRSTTVSSTRCSACRDSQSGNLEKRVVLKALTALIGLSGLNVQRCDAIDYGIDYKKELARRRRKIPEEEYTEGPDGLKYFDIVVGEGAVADVGERVAVHYDVKFRNVTFVTTRQGLGVTGGTPVGFNVGTVSGEPGSTLPGIDLGVRGMKVGGVRRLIVPPNLAFGKFGAGEIPPNATLNIDVELLSIKTSPFGFRVKLVEG
ncbi:hypothetical protein CEUSTIGMA_g3342.t1 [Chlamydomonas eustigma]|uniref:peptidylprolyl isomerase n=1 Tax=Chlamydomonas eustigma TaxID=1157962 RepID=A0A250WYX4_9CHLO|nr:hypothetical protein CEUSTIGMA_g3342.t1 [Chlamydomonas eustigma]|eukprot:GAX75899.1 hypothetical protein CEUSTIGMA_g3342.t1 [Chlamydomonas eustigma]